MAGQDYSGMSEAQLEALASGGVASPQGVSPAPASPPVTADGDPAVWALLGEDQRNPAGQFAVASTIVNRMKLGKYANPAAVVADPANGFEAYNNPTTRAAVQDAFPPTSDGYQHAQQLLQGLLSGKVKPLPYDGFYSPAAQSQDGRPAPHWDNGHGTDIGGNRFFSGVYNPGQVADAPTGDAPQQYTDAQLEALAGGGGESPSDPANGAWYDDVANVTRGPNNEIISLADSTNHGSHVNPDGSIVLNITAGKQDFDPANIAAWLKAHPRDPSLQPQTPVPEAAGGLSATGLGFARGVDQLSNTANQGQLWLDRNVPGFGAADRFVSPLLGMPTGEQAAENSLIGEHRYDNAYAGNDYYNFGKLGGQIAATAPIMAATDGAAGLLADAVPGVGGALAAARAYGPLTPQGALFRGATGALQGAEAAGLNYDPQQPLGNQLIQGAITGGVLNPAIGALAPVVRGGTNSLMNVVRGAGLPFSEAGRGQIADNVIRQVAENGPTDVNDATLVPDSSPTLGQATGNSGITTLERSVRDVRTAPFVNLEKANQAARIAHMVNASGTPETIEALEQARDQATAPLRERAFATAGHADASPVVSAIDEILASPAGQRDAVRNNLMDIREKLTSQPHGIEADGSQIDRGPLPLPSPGQDDIARALKDVQEARSPQTGGLFRAIQEMGGIKVRNADGSIVAGPDVMGALNGKTAPGLINNRAGLPAEQMAQALQDRGWFEANVDDPSKAFEDALSAHARGSAQFKPVAYAADAAQRAQGLDQEMQMAGVNASDSFKTAAAKLANHRIGDAQEAAAIQGETPDPALAEFDRLSAPKPSLLADKTQDPAQLYGIRQSINDALDPVMAREKPGAKLAASQMLQVRSALDDAIEKAAPGFKNYLSTYSEMSRPIDAQKYMQGLNLTGQDENIITQARVKSALDAIRRKRALSGVNGAKALSADQIDALRATYEDLMRQSNSSLGKSIGSNSVQNLATHSLAAQAGAPLTAIAALAAHHPQLAPLGLLGRWAYQANNERILDALTNRLIDPTLGASALAPPSVVPSAGNWVPGALRGVNDNIIPAASIYVNNKLQQQPNR